MATLSRFARCLLFVFALALPAAAQGAITFVAANCANACGVVKKAIVTITKPAGIAVNDYMLAHIFGSSSTFTVATPAGWTLILSHHTQGPRMPALMSTVYGKFANAADVAAASFAFTLDQSVFQGATMVAYRGTDLVSPVVATGTGALQPSRRHPLLPGARLA